MTPRDAFRRSPAPAPGGGEGRGFGWEDDHWLQGHREAQVGQSCPRRARTHPPRACRNPQNARQEDTASSSALEDLSQAPVPWVTTGHLSIFNCKGHLRPSPSSKNPMSRLEDWTCQEWLAGPQSTSLGTPHRTQ